MNGWAIFISSRNGLAVGFPICVSSVCICGQNNGLNRARFPAFQLEIFSGWQKHTFQMSREGLEGGEGKTLRKLRVLRATKNSGFNPPLK